MSLDDAHELFRQDRADEAEVAYRAVIDAGDDVDGEGTYWLALLLTGRRPADAEVLWRDLIALGQARGWSGLGGLLRDHLGRPAEAEGAYREAARMGEAGAWHDVGIILHQRGDLEGAEAAYREALAGGVTIANGNLGLLLASTDRPGEAEAVYRQVLEDGFHWHLADLLAGQPGREADAEEAYRGGIAAGTTEMWVELGWFLRNQAGRDADSEAAFRAGVEAGHTRGLRGLASVLIRDSERADEAEAAYRAAIAAGEEAALPDLANFLWHARGREEDATVAYEAAIGAGNTELWHHFGQLQLRQGRTEAAAVAFQQAVAHGDTHGWLGLAIVLEDDDAKRAALRAAIDAGHHSARIRLAALGDDDEALALYHEAVAAGDEQAWKLLAAILTGQLGGIPQTETDVPAELEERYRDEGAFVELAEILTLQGRRDEAAEAFREAVGEGELGALIGVAFVVSDRAASEQALRAAAYAGNADASLLLGALLTGVPGAAADAEAAYVIALDAGIEEAERGLAILRGESSD